MDPGIAGGILHAFVDLLSATIILRIAYEYRGGTFSKLFAFLGIGFLISGLAYPFTAHTPICVSETIHTATILVFIVGFYWTVMKYKNVLLPVIKGLK
ncbi:MAG: hypothetical protein ACE5K4_09280 [Candidatus Hydrothermarchaeota archaeon]